MDFIIGAVVAIVSFVLGASLVMHVYEKELKNREQ